MEVLSLENVKLPRINNRYNRNFSLKKEYVDAKNVLKAEMMSRNIELIPSPYSITIDVGTHYDIDSYIKPLLDAMQDVKIIDNDKNVCKLTIHKTPVRRNVPNWIIVEVETL